MKRTTIICMIKIVVSWLLLCVFSGYYSPFIKGCYCYDVSYYNVIGRLIKADRIPYVDFYEIKGPVFLYFQALGQSISTTRWGVFILECLLMGISVLILHMIGELCGLKQLYGVVLFFVYQYVFIKVFWGTCTVEELTLPLNLFALYCAFDQLYRNSATRAAHVSWWRFVILGVMFSLGVFSKITTIAPLCVCFLFTIILILLDSSKKAAAAILCFILGFLITTAAVIGHSVYRGYFSDMFTWVFEKAALRGLNKAVDINSGMIVRSFLIVFIIAYAMLKIHRRIAGRQVWLLLFISVSTFIMLQIGDRWSYYYLQLVPMLIVFLVVFYEDLINIKNKMQTADEKKRRLWMGTYLFGLFCFILVFTMFKGDVSKNVYDSFNGLIGKSNIEEEKAFSDITMRIASDDRNGVFCFEDAIFYFDVSGILPANFCPGFVNTFAFLDDTVEGNRCEELKERRPIWVIGKNTAENEQDSVLQALNNEYSMIYSDDLGYELWKRNKQ